MLSLSGYLIKPDVPSDSISRETLADSLSLTYIGRLVGTRWEKYQYTSDTPLLNEVEEGSYSYLVICRRSGPKFIILSVSKGIVDYIINSPTADFFPKSKIKKVQFKINDLVNALVDKPDPYQLTYVHADVSGNRLALRSMSFYGDDLANSELFREHYEKFTCHGCGLRAAGGGIQELIRLNNNGSLSFQIIEPNQAVGIEKILNYLSDNDFMIEPEKTR